MNTALSPHEHTHNLEGLLEPLFETFLPPQWAEFFIHFIGDAVNILLILFVVMFFVSLFQTYIPFEKLKGRLSALGGIWGTVLALALGVFSPFCSCTIVPVVMGLVSVGVPVGVSLCYLSSAAILNGGTLVALFSAFGVRFGIVYLVLAVTIAVLASVLVRPFAGKENILSYTVEHRHGTHLHSEHCEDEHCLHHEPHGRIGYAMENVGHIFKQTWLYMLLSVAIASALLSFISADSLRAVLGQYNVFSPLLAGVIAAPIHADIFSSLPLLRILVPINPSAALSFALAGMAISIPEVLLLSRVFKAKTTVAYSVILTILSITAGYAVWVLAQFLTVF